MTEQMHTPLKPCPFCGGKAVLRETIEHYPADEDGPAGDVSCRFEVDCDECGISRSEECRDDAVADWNRRADAASSQERIAQLEAIIDLIDERAPRADCYCLEPGITISEAARRTLVGDGHPAFAALGAQPLAPEPEGWKLVPVMPTPEMLGAWYSYKSGFHFHDDPPPPDTSDYGAYRAMLAAAPERIVGAAK